MWRTDARGGVQNKEEEDEEVGEEDEFVPNKYLYHVVLASELPFHSDPD